MCTECPTRRHRSTGHFVLRQEVVAFFVNFSPAISGDARKAIEREIRSWRINRRSDLSLSDLARMVNPIVQGWINYYGRFYKSMLYAVLRRINDYLVRWAMRKYKGLHRHSWSGHAHPIDAPPCSGQIDGRHATL